MNNIFQDCASDAGTSTLNLKSAETLSVKTKDDFIKETKSAAKFKNRSKISYSIFASKL